MVAIEIKGENNEQLKKVQFASCFTIDEIRLQPVTQIPWGILVTVIMPKAKLHEEMLWYINETHKLGCSLQPKYLGGP